MLGMMPGSRIDTKNMPIWGFRVIKTCRGKWSGLWSRLSFHFTDERKEIMGNGLKGEEHGVLISLMQSPEHPRVWVSTSGRHTQWPLKIALWPIWGSSSPALNVKSHWLNPSEDHLDVGNIQIASEKKAKDDVEFWEPKEGDQRHCGKQEEGNKGYFRFEWRTSQPRGQGRVACRPWSSDDRAKDSVQGVMNWPQEKRNMLVHAFTKNSQPAKWFQISGSLLQQLRFQGEAEIVLDSCFPKCPFFSVVPRGSKHSLPVCFPECLQMMTSQTHQETKHLWQSSFENAMETDRRRKVAR